jgi:elongation factor P
MSVSTSDFRNGLVLVMDKGLMEIVEFQHVKPGKGGAFVRTKFRNILTGRVLERTFRSGEKFDEAKITEQPFQYLYHDGDLYHFMDTATYEQIGINADVVDENANYMKENETVTVMFHEGKPLAVKLPLNVELKVTKSDPGVQGDRSSGATKPATLETGATVQVPLFIEEGNVLRIDTRTGQYIERVN